MDKHVTDQAEGLRRLLAKSGSRVVAVTGGPVGVGCTSTVVNLAAALAGLGKDVLVIDECLGAHSVSAMVGGVQSAGNLRAFLDGQIGIEDAAPRHALGFSVLAASRENCAGYSAAQLGAMLSGPADVVLIDARLDRRGALSALAAQAHDVMVVTRVAAQAITEAYACMKRLHYEHAIAQFRVLVNHVSSPADAHTTFDNLAEVAARYLTVSIADAGCVAIDPLMERSLELGRCVVDAYPSAPAARDFRHVAAEMLYWPMRAVTRESVTVRTAMPASALADATAARHHA
ncbi:MinD/ParA family protein [Trinickia caryophylli]|uniref:MinD/ParA family ATP-binding protein n=1 Tax=Trinickia caryophylli TaxID=28094 RepID=UPI000A14DF5E|nr:flagellar biosynthesis protein FlhG [Trinickia caryophylli]PMS13283.1 flagellar biosynthesis protein FlhG [Trinickia caryophylli]TRX19190.1 MinD/ParA family protein [Trinickia caryophylli]WQE13511.1 MinD/ParA family protein [Trinickia caryophylli]GLU33957.1 flagellar biosynthesis protein FlhG [Trinickia caryophylli]